MDYRAQLLFLAGSAYISLLIINALIFLQRNYPSLNFSLVWKSLSPSPPLPLCPAASGLGLLPRGPVSTPTDQWWVQNGQLTQMLRFKKPSFSIGADNWKDHINLKMLEAGGWSLNVASKQKRVEKRERQRKRSLFEIFNSTYPCTCQFYERLNVLNQNCVYLFI